MNQHDIFVSLCNDTKDDVYMVKCLVEIYGVCSVFLHDCIGLRTAMCKNNVNIVKYLLSLPYDIPNINNIKWNIKHPQIVSIVSGDDRFYDIVTDLFYNTSILYITIKNVNYDDEYNKQIQDLYLSKTISHKKQIPDINISKISKPKNAVSEIPDYLLAVLRPSNNTRGHDDDIQGHDDKCHILICAIVTLDFTMVNSYLNDPEFLSYLSNPLIITKTIETYNIKMLKLVLTNPHIRIMIQASNMRDKLGNVFSTILKQNKYDVLKYIFNTHFVEISCFHDSIIFWCIDYECDIKILKLLLSYEESDPSCYDNFCLHRAASLNNEAAVAILLKHPKVNLNDGNKLVLTHLLIYNHKCIKLILDNEKVDISNNITMCATIISRYPHLTSSVLQHKTIRYLEDPYILALKAKILDIKLSKGF